MQLILKKLITLKKEISQSNLVIDFFQITNKDINQSTKNGSIEKYKTYSSIIIFRNVF